MLEWSKTGVTTVNVGAFPVSVARYSSSGVTRRGCGEGLFTSREKYRPLSTLARKASMEVMRALPNGQHPGQGGVDASSGVERGAHDHGELSSLRGQPQLQRRVLRNPRQTRGPGLVRLREIVQTEIAIAERHVDACEEQRRGVGRRERDRLFQIGDALVGAAEDEGVLEQVDHAADVVREDARLLLDRSRQGVRRRGRDRAAGCRLRSALSIRQREADSNAGPLPSVWRAAQKVD